MKTFLLLLLFTAPTAAVSKDDFDTFFDDLIREQEQEVQDLRKLREAFLKTEKSQKQGIREKYQEIRDKLREDFHQFYSARNAGAAVSLTRTDIRENATSYDVSVALHGLSKEDTKVEVKGSDLVISGRSHKEFSSGLKKFEESREFRQELHLSHKVDPRSLKLGFHPDKLTIHLEKARAL